MTGKCTLSPPYVRHLTLILVFTLFLVPCISADGYVGGIPLATVQSGTVSGGLYVDAELPSWGSTDVTKTFASIPSVDDIAWARLYVSVYSGNMQNNYRGTATVSFDGAGDGTSWIVVGAETLDTPGGYTYPGEGGTGPITVNDHCNRVTSDYLMWYNVTPLIISETPKARVVTGKTDGSFDGRIKMITLVVAYNDGDSDEVYYWVNQGHDVDSYLADDAGMPYTGQTLFDLSSLSGNVAQATLTVNHLASTDGTYAWNGDPIPTDPSGGNSQGAFFGYNIWDLTSAVIPGESNDLTYNRTGQFYKIPLATLAVKKSSTPPGDLEVTLVNPVTGNVFAKEPNTVRITVRNNGASPSSPTEVRLTSSDGFDGRGSVPSIAAGQTTIVSVTDTTVRNLSGGSVTYTATVDPDNLIPETNEGNNEKSSTSKTVLYNGYKGARYWEGKSDVLTTRTFDLLGGLLFSPGDSTYRAGGVGGSGWSSYTVTWTGSDLPLPAGATVREARLYVPYTWDDSQQVPDHFHLAFNGNQMAPDALYTDQSNFGGYANHRYGLLAYNVTQWFNPAGNTALLTKDNVNTNLAMYGLTLAVVYEDPSSTRKQVFLNEGFDILGADETQYGTTPGEATAYLPFSGMTTSPGDAAHASLTTFVPSGNGPEGDLLWNEVTIGTNVWDYGPSTGTQVAVDTRDVKSSLLASGNEAGIRSTATGATPLMAASHAFLVVEYSGTGPVADFAANVTFGPAPLTVGFTDQSSGTITAYAWDFQDDGTIDSTEKDPVYTYPSQGTYTVNLTVTGPAGSASEVKAGFITVTGPSHPDLVITQLSTNSNELFAHESNTINATVRNNGTASAGPFTVRIDASGAVYDVAIPGLDPGAQQEVQVTDTTLRTMGDSVTITATADPYSAVAESDESNNALSLTKTVANNGYKGKRWTGGSDLETVAVYEGRYDVVYSPGDSAYRSAKWLSATVNWTPADLPVPAGATILDARLYQPYSYNKMGTDPAFFASFNGVGVSPVATYRDIKGYEPYNYPYGLYAYDVTGLFDAEGNTLVLTPEGTPGTTNDYALFGAYLVVIYGDRGTTEKRIWINEEFDMLYAGSARSVTSEEATAYAVFAGVDTTDMASAEAVAVLASAGDAGKSRFFFNEDEYTGFWADYLATPQIGFSVYDVSGAIASGENVARLQSYDSGSGGDNMYAMTTILVLEKAEPGVTANFNATPRSGTVPLTVQFTDESTGTITSRTWDFGDGNTSVGLNPSHTYTLPGTYTVNLTVSGPGGSDSEVKANYITVTAPPVPPVARFTANPTSGTAPLAVQFTDQSTGSIAERVWEFRPERGVWTQFSTSSNPSYTFADAATYDIRLTVRGPGGESTEEKIAYISVLSPGGLRADFSASPTSGFSPLSVMFTDQSTGTVTLRTWDFNNDGRWDSIARNPTYRFWNPGVYTVRLAVSGPDGSDQTVKHDYITVTVLPKPPVARFTQDTKVGNAPLTVRFTDLSTGTPESYLWTFGDGGTSTEPSPVHTYQAPGLYRVTLWVENEGGASTATGYAYVIRPFRPS
ncbi:MAG: PKD domain protein [Methanoregulaceae archaeon PtaU1.Bin059]|nr:MAG: PKD domain protein [Methanoregulaceae archaeon PtaB.Bin152]OPY43456.1 MAG: PKD domain protein [Methanoregulaceae archaeon PtaU1.Bin059]